MLKIVCIRNMHHLFTYLLFEGRFFFSLFLPFSSFLLFGPLFTMPNHSNDIENNARTLNYNSITSTSQHATSTQRQTQAEQRQRVILFAILVVVSMSCVFTSYIVSSASKPSCSDRIIWMPSCNREEY